jgi:hypothetical protein
MKLELVGDDAMAVLPVPAPAGKHRLELVLAAGTD